MRLRGYIWTLFAAILVAIFASATKTLAQAKEGTWDGTYSYYGAAKATQIGKERLLLVYDQHGITVGDGMFNHVTWHCWGLGDFTKDVGEDHGYCAGMDPAGDEVALSWIDPKYSLNQKSEKGTLTFIAGTGKLTSITGSGTFETPLNTSRAA
jgi:hypothetical protein